MAVESGLAREVLVRLREAGVMDRLGQAVNHRLPRLIKISGITPEFSSRFRELTGQGMVPLVVAGHFAHVDAVVISDLCFTLQELASEAGLQENLRGFAMTLARSVPEGHQSVFMQSIYSRMEEYARARNVEFIPVTRERDQERYGMRGSLNEKRPLVSKFRQKGIGGVMFAGGSVQPGRHPNGNHDEIYGLQEVEDTDLPSLFDLMERSGRHIVQKPYILPVGIDGTYRLQNSDSLFPTLEGVVSLYDIPSYLLGLVGFQRVNVEINVGMPMTDEIWRERPQDLNSLVMQRVARLLPPHTRGFYND